MASIETGLVAGKRIVEKLGFHGKKVQKIVLEVDVRKVPTLYVKMVSSNEDTDTIVNAFIEAGYETKIVDHLEVKPDCTVEHGTDSL